MIKVYGSSDDRIEVEGEKLNEEFYGGEQATYLSFSDGTLLSCVYSDDALWHFAVLQKGTSFVSKDECIIETSERHSDYIFLGDDVKWVMFGSQLERAKEKKPDGTPAV